MVYEERKIWTTGRRGCNACVTALIYPNSIVATGDPERLTFRMMERALDREFPSHTFYFRKGRDGLLHCDADRWTNDGIEEPSNG